MISSFCVVITEIVRSNAKNRIALKAVRTKLITRLLLMGNCQLSCQSFVNDGIMSLVKVPVQHESACQSFIALSDLCWLNPNAKLFTLTMEDIFSHFLPSTIELPAVITFNLDWFFKNYIYTACFSSACVSRVIWQNQTKLFEALEQVIEKWFVPADDR